MYYFRTSSDDPKMQERIIFEKVRFELMVWFFSWVRKNTWIHCNRTVYAFTENEVCKWDEFGKCDAYGTDEQSVRICEDLSCSYSEPWKTCAPYAFRRANSDQTVGFQCNHITRCVICGRADVRGPDSRHLLPSIENPIVTRINVLRDAKTMERFDSEIKRGICCYCKRKIQSGDGIYLLSEKQNYHIKFINKIADRKAALEHQRKKFKEKTATAFQLLNSAKNIKPQKYIR